MAVLEKISASTPPLTAPAPENVITVRSPVTGNIVGTVPMCSADEVRAAVDRARAAQPAWEALGVRARGRLLKKWMASIWDDQARLTEIVRSETGKPDGGVYEEVVVMDLLISFLTYNAPRILRPQKRKALVPFVHRAKVVFKPYGVVGAITPWNFPFLNAFNDLSAALIAGNTVVLKPSELTPFTALYVMDKMHEAGIPKDVIQIVTGAGATGAALVDMADDITFTGSTATGRKIAMRAAERLIPYSLELGGKDPAIVLHDADLDRAALGILCGGLENAGQVCVSTERVYVDQRVYDPLMGKLMEKIGTFRMSAGDGFDVDMGSMTNERELVRTEDHLRDAVEKGARILHGGKRRPDLGPLFFEPTILVDVDHTMKVMQEETFGPVIPVMAFEREADAIRLANDSIYGLSAVLYSKNLSRAADLAAHIESGDVSINRPNLSFATPGVPMGGRKQSGVGRRNGKEGLLRFVSMQAIVTDTGFGSSPSLNNWDKQSVFYATLMRHIRRVLPFI